MAKQKRPYEIVEVVFKDWLEFECEDCGKVLTRDAIRVQQERKSESDFYCRECFRFLKKTYETMN